MPRLFVAAAAAREQDKRRVVLEAPDGQHYLVAKWFGRRLVTLKF